MAPDTISALKTGVDCSTRSVMSNQYPETLRVGQRRLGEWPSRYVTEHRMGKRRMG